MLGDARTSASIDYEFIVAGDSVQSEIDKRLKRCDMLLVVVTESSIKSGWVTYELIKAAKYGKIVIPFVPHPLHDLPQYLRDLAYVTDIAHLKKHIAQHGIVSHFGGEFGPLPSEFDLLQILYITLILTGCVGATKVVNPNWWLDPFFGVSVITFAGLLFVSDVVHEVYGERAATSLIIPGILTTIVMGVILIFFMYLPAAHFSGWNANDEVAFDHTVSGIVSVIFLGAIAYLATHLIDIKIFKFLTRRWDYRYSGARNFLSTIVAQIFNTTIYIIVVYRDGSTLNLLLGHMAAKVGIASFGALFFRKITRYFIEIKSRGTNL